jgi:hypothetical protein
MGPFLIGGDRHREKNKYFIYIVIVGNAFVGLAGAFYSLHDKVAEVLSHIDFLPVSLGAIFGGNAISIVISQILHKKKVDVHLDPSDHTTSVSKFRKKLIDVFSRETDDSKKIGVLLFTYTLGCLFITEIQGLIRSKAIEKIIPSLKIPHQLEHLFIALTICLFIWWAGVKEKD